MQFMIRHCVIIVLHGEIMISFLRVVSIMNENCITNVLGSVYKVHNHACII